MNYIAVSRLQQAKFVQARIVLQERTGQNPPLQGVTGFKD